MMVDALEENVMKDILSMGLEQNQKPVIILSSPHCWPVWSGERAVLKSPQMSQQLMIRAKDKVVAANDKIQQHLAAGR